MTTTSGADQISAALSGGWGRRLMLSLPIGLAFADASIVLLALPEIVARLHTSISHVVWVIIVYNLALIVGSLAVRFAPQHFDAERMLVVGLLLFGVASLASGLAPNVKWLVAFRAVQGIGGATLLCASLPPLARGPQGGEASLSTWASAAAVGAAIGPAAGGILTQLFDWRAIFLAQAPVAGLAALGVWALNRQRPLPTDFAEPTDGAPPGGEPVREPEPRSFATTPPLIAARANVALGLLSAGLIGALFLSTLLLINVWGLKPIVAALVLLMLPLMTGLTGRLGRALKPAPAAAIGAVALTVGLALLATVSHEEIAVCLVALALSGAGLGVSFTALTHEALRSAHDLLGRVANTIAARDRGLVVGLLILTPIFVHQLNEVQNKALPPITRAVLATTLPRTTELQLAGGLLAAVNAAPQSELPNIAPAFAQVEQGAPPSSVSQLRALEPQVESIIRSAATKAFRPPLFIAAAFPVLVLLLVAVPLPATRRRVRE